MSSLRQLEQKLLGTFMYWFLCEHKFLFLQENCQSVIAGYTVSACLVLFSFLQKGTSQTIFQSHFYIPTNNVYDIQLVRVLASSCHYFLKAILM